MSDVIRFSTLGSTIIKAVYGLDTTEKDDKYIRAADRATKSIELLATTTSSLLQYFPVIAHIPTWLPGTGFLRHLKQACQWAKEMRLLPWNDAKLQLVGFLIVHLQYIDMVTNYAGLIGRGVDRRKYDEWAPR